MFKKYIQKRLEKYVRKYFKRHQTVKLVVVAGSVGKTSAKMAIATVLADRFRVRLKVNSRSSVFSAPLAILGIDYPKNAQSLSAWLAVFSAARRRIQRPTDVDVIIQELNSSYPGQLAHLANYMKPDMAIITAISSKDIEVFGSIDAVAKENLSLANFSHQAIINRDDIDSTYAKYITNSNIVTYGTSGVAEYKFITEDFSIKDGYKGVFITPDQSEPIPVNIKVVGDHSLHPVIAAGVVATKLGLPPGEIATGLTRIKSVPGRMNLLRGVKNSFIIDDSYDSNPLSARSALQALYQLSAPQKIAVLGSMSNLGITSIDEHKTLGQFCSPEELAWVVTVGQEANTYLALAAKTHGCQVKSFTNTLEAGAFINSVLEPNAIVLFKGSKNGVFLEEAIKVILYSTTDETKLVRQSSSWLAKKRDLFSSFSS